MFPLLDTVDNHGISLTGGEVLFWLVVILVVLAIVYLAQRIR